MIGSGAFACLFIHKMSLARISLIGEQKGNIQLEHLARKDSCIWIPDSGISVSWMLIGHVISMENPWSSGCIGAEGWSRMWTSLSQGSEKLLVATWPFGLPPSSWQCMFNTFFYKSKITHSMERISVSVFDTSHSLNHVVEWKGAAPSGKSQVMHACITTWAQGSRPGDTA